MLAPPDDDARTQRELAAAWRRLAAALGDDALARRLHGEVLGPLADPPGAPKTSQTLLGWLAMAESLAGWERFEKALDARPRGDAPAGAWERLRDRCGEALRRLERRNANARAAKWLLLHLRIDQSVFNEAGAVLESCREAFDGLARQAADQGESLPWARIDQLREEANKSLRRRDWAPSLLRELPDGWLGRLRESLAQPAKFDRLDDPRQALLAWAAREADASRADWLRGWAARLLAPAGLQAEVLAEPDAGGRRELWEKVADPECDQPAVERLAVVVRKKGERGGKCLVKGRWRVSGRPPHVAQLRPAARTLRRLQPPEEALASLCEEVERGWPRDGRDADWWRQAAPEARERVWRMLQHLSLLAEDAPVAGLLQAFEDAGFRLVEAPPGAAGEDWFLVPSAPAPDRTRVQRGPALRGPDGSVFGPALWLRLPQAEAARPLVRCLVETQPLRTMARWRNVAGPPFDEQAWGAAMNGPEADAERGRELFEKCYRLLEGAADADARGVARELTLRLYRCLTDELGQKPFPPLDPAAARPIAVSRAPEGTAIDWDTESREPRGAVVAVRRFGYPGAPGEVVLSAGPGLPGGLRDWLRLPPSDAPLLREWLQQARRLVAHPEEYEPAERQAREAFGGWLREAGAGWFDQLCQAALRGEPESRRWLEALARRRWCESYPRVKGDVAEWPAGAPPAAEEVVWDWSETEPLGRAVLVKRFAAEPASARCLVSLGRRDDRPALARLAELRDGLSWLREHVGGAVEECWEKLLLAALEKKDPRAPNPIALVRPLESLAREPSPERRRDLDRYVAAVRAWLHTLGLALRPEGDVFTDPAPRERRFDPSPAGSLLSVRFAVGQEDEAQLVVSAGPGPPCYLELLGLLRGGEPAAGRLAAKLLAWPGLLADPGNEAGLQQLSRDLFAAFHDEDPQWRGGERARLAEERLLDLVRDAGLVVTVPRLHEPCGPSWKCYNDRGEEVSPSSLARVERVLTPGLELPTGEAYLVPKVVVREVGP